MIFFFFFLPAWAAFFMRYADVFIYMKAAEVAQTRDQDKGSKIRRMCVRLSAEQCGAPQENGEIYTSARAGNRDPQTLWWWWWWWWREGVCARARPGQWPSSPAVSDVTVGLCVSGVWSKSITESKKPNATNHVHNSSSIGLCLTLSPPSSGSLAEHKCSYSGQRTEYRTAITHSGSALMQTAEAHLRSIFHKPFSDLFIISCINEPPQRQHKTFNPGRKTLHHVEAI